MYYHAIALCSIECDGGGKETIGKCLEDRENAILLSSIVIAKKSGKEL